MKCSFHLNEEDFSGVGSAISREFDILLETSLDDSCGSDSDFISTAVANISSISGLYGEEFSSLEEGRRKYIDDLFEKAREHKKARRFRKAIDCYTDIANSNDQRKLKGVELRGICYGVKKQFEKARKDITYCLKENKKHWTAKKILANFLYIIGLIHFHEKNFVESFKQLTKSLRILERKDGYFFRAFASAHLENRNYKDIRSDLMKSMDKKSKNKMSKEGKARNINGILKSFIKIEEQEKDLKIHDTVTKRRNIAELFLKIGIIEIAENYVESAWKSIPKEKKELDIFSAVNPKEIGMVHYVRGKILIRSGKKREALKELKMAFKNECGEPRVLFDLAFLVEDLKDYWNALKLYDIVISQHCSIRVFYEAYLHRGICLGEIARINRNYKEYDQSIGTYTNLLLLKTDAPRIEKKDNEGFIFYEQNCDDKSLKSLVLEANMNDGYSHDLIIKCFINSAMCHIEKALLLVFDEGVKESEDSYRKSIRNCEFALEIMSMVSDRANKYIIPISQCNYLIGRALMGLLNYEAAIKYFTKSTSMNKNFAAAYCFHGIAYLKMRENETGRVPSIVDHKKALEFIEKAISIDAHYSPALRYRDVYRDVIGKRKKGTEKCKNVDPFHVLDSLDLSKKLYKKSVCDLQSDIYEKNYPLKKFFSQSSAYLALLDKNEANNVLINWKRCRKVKKRKLSGDDIVEFKDWKRVDIARMLYLWICKFKGKVVSNKFLKQLFQTYLEYLITGKTEIKGNYATKKRIDSFKMEKNRINFFYDVATIIKMLVLEMKSMKFHILRLGITHKELIQLIEDIFVQAFLSNYVLKPQITLEVGISREDMKTFSSFSSGNKKPRNSLKFSKEKNELRMLLLGKKNSFGRRLIKCFQLGCASKIYFGCMEVGKDLIKPLNPKGFGFIFEIYKNNNKYKFYPVFEGKVNGEFFHGEGKMIDISSQEVWFRGNFNMNKKEGICAEYRVENGRVSCSFEGEYRNGERNGPGRLYLKEKSKNRKLFGKYKQGVWKNGKFVKGSGKIVKKIPVALLPRNFDFDRETILGEGSFSVVRRVDVGNFCELKSLSNDETEENYVAVKRFKNLSDKEKSDRYQKVSIIYGYCKEMKSNRIVEILALLQNSGGDCEGMIMECCQCSVWDRLKSYKDEDLCGDFKYKAILQVAEGMKKMNEHFLIHRDLNWRNVLIDMNDDMKICDFDFLAYHRERFCLEYSCCFAAPGSPFHNAPELIDGDYENKEVYSDKIDVFSFGIMLYELYYQQLHPYSDYFGNKCPCDKCNFVFPRNAHTKFEKHIKECNLRPKIKKDKNVPLYIIDLMKSCWENERDKRPSFKEIYKSIDEKRSIFEIMDPKKKEEEDEIEEEGETEGED